MRKDNLDCEIEWIDIYTNFELERCFCSCMGEHNKDCPNFDKIYDEKPTKRIVMKFKNQDCIAEFTVSDIKYYIDSGKSRNDFSS